MPISPKQTIAARGLLGWTQTDLAGAAEVGLSTIKNFESELRTTKPQNLIAIHRALERAGIEFLPARSGKGVGVRLAVV
jgi:transcriptional regulator with XRE-family HTH domain